MTLLRWIPIFAALTAAPSWSGEIFKPCPSLASLPSAPVGARTCGTEYTVGHDSRTGDLRWVHYRLNPPSAIVSPRINPLHTPTDSPYVSYPDPEFDAAQLIPPSLHAFNEDVFEEAKDSLVTVPMHKHLHRSLEFNGDWAVTSRWERHYATDRPGTEVFAGPIYSQGQSRPSHYFKVYYDSAVPAMMAMIFANEAGINDAYLAHNVVTVDCVEERTGLNFFSGVQDEDDLENDRAITVRYWNMIDGHSRENGCK